MMNPTMTHHQKQKKSRNNYGQSSSPVLRNLPRSHRHSNHSVQWYLKGRDFNYDRILVELAATEAAAIQFGRGYENYWQESGNNAFWAFNSYNSDGDSLTMGYYGGNSTDDHIHRLHGTFTNAAEATLTSKWAQQSAYNDTYIDAGSYMRLIKMD